MPKLCRLRLVSIGHPNARFDDLTFNFRNADTAADNSTIWLRNGGGKSSLLNLFFALIRPNKRDFLGGKADAKQRTIGDYIKTNDRAVVAAEWELDKNTGSQVNQNATKTFLTGVYYEWRHSGGKNLRRLFFSTLTNDSVRFLSLENLPIYFQDSEGLRRRTLADFRQEWGELRKKYPEQNVSYTENQTEWASILDNARIDPELFLYQVKMNLREGGVDEIFRFNDNEQFIDFLLELIIDPSFGEKIGRNIETFRSQLQNRKDSFIPEKELVEGLISQFAPLIDIAVQRKQLHEKATKESTRYHLLSRYINDRINRLSELSCEELSVSENKLQEAEIAEQDARSARELSAIFRFFAASKRYKKADEDYKRLEKEHSEAQRIKNIWKAAGPLSRTLKYENRALQYKKELKIKQKEHAPILKRLEAAAFQYAGVLCYHARQNRGNAKIENDKEKKLRKEATEYREMASECNANKSADQANVKHIQQFIEEATHKRQHLEKEGFLQKNEMAKEAIHLFQNIISTGNSRIEEIIPAIESKEHEINELRKEKEMLGSNISRLKTLVETGNKEYDLAEKARSELESNVLLLRYLEQESISLEVMSDAQFSILGNRSCKIFEDIISIKMEQAEDERAVHYIETKGLLPPTTEVEVALQTLNRKIPTAWPGWAFLEANVKDPKRQKSIIDRHPHLMTGIIVRDNDYEKAVQILRETPDSPDHPIVVAPQRSLKDTSQPGWTVIGPGTRAFFDKPAAQNELQKRQNRLDTTDDRLKQYNEDRENLDELRQQLRQFRRRYPSGWFDNKVEEISKLENDIEFYIKKGEALSYKISEFETENEQLKLEKDRLSNEIFSSEIKVTKLESYVVNYENALPQKQEELKSLNKKISSLEEEMINYRNEADRTETEAGEYAKKAGRLNEDARSFEEDMKRISYFSGEPEPTNGAIDSCKNNYETLKGIYEEKIGKEGLLQQIKEAESDAKSEREQFNKLKTEIITEKLVNSYLEKLDGGSKVEEQLNEADKNAQSLLGKLGNKKQERNSYEDKLDSCTTECHRLNVSTDLSKHQLPPGPIQAEESANREDEKAIESEEKAVTCRQESNESKQKHKDYENQISIIKKDLAMLETLKTDTFPDLISDKQGEDSSWNPPKKDREIELCINDLKASFNRLTLDHGKLDEDRRIISKKIIRWAKNEKFEAIKNRISKQISETDPLQLETKAQEWTNQLKLRAKIIKDQLEDVEKHRKLLIKETLQAAEEGIEAIKNAVRQSRLPDHVPGHGGKKFLNIHMRELNDQDECKGRIGELIDQLIDEGRLPGGLALVQRAVQRLIRPVKVRVLNPDPDVESKSVEITDMAKFSGGEQLTGAILLYCTLAQLRARKRLQSKRPASVLILDNPIGRASRLKFLELQREVASAMNIQLIYTTAVNDFEAIHTFPNIIRVRNTHIDRNTGNRIISIDELNNQIDLVHITRIKPKKKKPDGKPDNEIPN